MDRRQTVLHKIKILLLLFFLGFGAFLMYFFFQKDPERKEEWNCVTVPVSFFPFVRTPLIKVEIEGKRYTLTIDTGSSQQLELHSRVLKKVRDKQFLRTSRFYDIKGTSYCADIFSISPIKFHRCLEMSGLVAQEENVDFLTTGTKIEKAKSLLGKIKESFKLFLIDGRVGWSALSQLACYFDLHNGSLLLAKDLDALEKEGIMLTDFIKVPMEFSRAGPVLSVETEFGVKKFMLDSGASHSVFREFDQTTEDQVLALSVEGYPLGNWNLIPFPITSDLESEFYGALGIDFFKAFEICFDFPNQNLYLRKRV